MQQILVRIPGIGIPIFGFGAMLFIAFLTCTWLAGRRARREGIAPEHIQDLAIWLFVGGLLGARILYLIKEANPPPADLIDFLWQLPRIWDGGIILYGSLVGGFLGYIGFYWFTFRRYGISTLKLADIIAPSIALGIGFGRIGCFLNGCCYGQVACAACMVYPVHFPLSAPPRYSLVPAGYQTVAGFIYDENQPDKYVRVGRVVPGSPAEQAGLKRGDLIVKAEGEPLSGNGPDISPKLEHLTPTERLSCLVVDYWERGRNQLTLTLLDPDTDKTHDIVFTPRTIGLHPTQLYETISMVLLFLVLTALYPLRHRQGLVMAVFMMGYAVHRTLNELLRDDPRPIGLESYSSYFLFAAGLALAIYVLLWGQKVETNVPAETTSETKIMVGASGPA